MNVTQLAATRRHLLRSLELADDGDAREARSDGGLARGDGLVLEEAVDDGHERLRGELYVLTLVLAEVNRAVPSGHRRERAPSLRARENVVVGMQQT